MKVYLAGRISKHDWRGSICTSLDAGGPSDDIGSWAVAERAIDGVHDYVGPFFIACDHGCAHSGADAHGVDACERAPCIQGRLLGSTNDRRSAITHLCLEAVRNADFVFAWLEDQEAFGTLVEIGYAVALNKPVYVGVRSDVSVPDLWFATTVVRGFVRQDNARDAFDAAMLQYLSASSRRACFESWKTRCESPIEVAMFEALFWGGRVGINESTGAAGNTTHDMHQQYETCGYRLDFALIPVSAGKRVAVECDGHNFHDRTPEQAARDKARDRKLTEAGWTVLRFTGREIHRDAEACAAQAWRVARGS